MRYEFPTAHRDNGFSWQCGVNHFALGFPAAPHPLSSLRTTGLARDNQHPGWPSPLRHRRHSSAPSGRAGILTGIPSPTPFGLSLGSPNPGRTNLPQEPLGFRRTDFSSVFSLLIPGFSLLHRPVVLTVYLHPSAARSPTTPASTIIFIWKGGDPRRRLQV